MARSLITPQRSFPLVLVLTVIASLLPGRALGWTNLLSEFLSMGLNPFATMGNMLGESLRPQASRGFDSGIDGQKMKELQDLMVENERLYKAEQAKVESLQRQLEQLQKIPRELTQTPVKIVFAHVGLRSPSSAIGLVVLDRGLKQGVRPGAIAVFDGVNLVGRVTDEVSNVQCTLLPLANLKTPPIEAAVFAKDRSQTLIANAPRIHLEPKGDGTLIAQPDKSEVINVGDEVVLIDANWPQSAQAMKIGIIESVRTNDLEPLRNIVVVRPAYQLSRLSSVVLKIEMDQGEEAPVGDTKR